ncbi:MAG: hypothetical protein FGM54_03125 [Chitinophagaceae bacterium]|nr:hypothetical protein [Chitinophagaceae bacterium]
MEQPIQHFQTKRNFKPFLFILMLQMGLMFLIAWAMGEPLSWGTLLFSPFISTGFLLYDYYKTHYRIENGILYIQSAWFKSSIPVHEIRKIKRINSWLSAPATSNKRLELTYKKYNHIEISPSDVDGFIAAVKAENPGVELVV